MQSNWNRLKRKLSGGKADANSNRRKRQRLSAGPVRPSLTKAASQRKAVQVDASKAKTKAKKNDDDKVDVKGIKFDSALTIHRYTSEALETAQRDKETEHKIDQIRKKNAQFSKQFKKEYFVKKKQSSLKSLKSNKSLGTPANSINSINASGGNFSVKQVKNVRNKEKIKQNKKVSFNIKNDTNSTNDKNSNASSSNKSENSKNGTNEKIEKNEVKTASTMINDMKAFRLQKREMQLLELKPKEGISSDERLKFWNNIRLNLRARLPQSFLYEIITETPENARLHNVDGKLTNVLAMDCEMVGVIRNNGKNSNNSSNSSNSSNSRNSKNGNNSEYSALARVSIVNFDGQTVFDQFVKPRSFETIVNYRTEVSGIIASDIKNGMEYEECRKQVIDILKGRKIVGHSIENDFKVFGGAKFANELKKEYYVKLVQDQIKSWQKIRNKHEARKTKDTTGISSDYNSKLSQEAKIATKKVRDLKRLLNKLAKPGNDNVATNKKLAFLSTDNSYFFDTAKCELLHKDVKKPFGLKFLLELFLGVKIQEGSHDSIQDSVATMALYRSMIPEIQHWIKQQKIKKKFGAKDENKLSNKKDDVKKGKHGKDGKDGEKGKKDSEKSNEEKMNEKKEGQRRPQRTYVNYAYQMEIDTHNIPTMGFRKTKKNEKREVNNVKQTKIETETKPIAKDTKAYRSFLFG